MTDSDRIDELTEKVDRLLELAPTIEALGRILIRRRTAAKRGVLHRTTIDKNKNIDKFEEVGHKRTFIEIGDVAVIKQRKRSAK
jgi:hypothetical protein